jgi:heat-inducible transcriptional repressor
MSELTHRGRKILFSVVTEFIATGDPVGSRTLARKYGLDLSAASVRNVLADLEEAGYLKQPHTSAGRIPTDRALRLFIDTLMEVRSVSPQEQARIGERFAEIYAVADDPLRATGKLLSELSGAAGVVAPPRSEMRALAQLRFIPTKPKQLLAVLVFADGTVENRFIQVEEGVPESELTRVHNLLADVIEGRTLGEVRDLFARRMADEKVLVDALRRRAFELGSRAIEDVSRRTSVENLVIEGHTRLMDLPEYGDSERMKKLMRALEEREELVALLDKTLSAGAVTVFIGSEAGEIGSAGDLSLVVAPYTERGRVAGTVGVLGPTRMDYAKVMPLVDATAAAMSEALNKPSK